MNKKIHLVLAAIMALTSNFAYGQATSEPKNIASSETEAESTLKNIIDDFLKKTSSILGSSRAEKDKIAEVRKIFEQNLDIAGIGSRVLGKEKKKLTPEQLSEFQSLFYNYILSFASKANLYNGQQVKIINITKYNKDIYSVKTEIQDKQKGLLVVEYQVKFDIKTNNFKIMDVTTSNISMVSNLKSQFVNVLSEPDGFKKLKEFLQNNSK